MWPRRAGIWRSLPRVRMFETMPDLNLTKMAMVAGGGDFSLPHLSVGVFLNDQPTHRLALGSDRRRDLPLAKHEGWLLSAGSEGICEYDDVLDVVIIAFGECLLAEVGLERPQAIAPHIGPFDPLTLQLALAAEAFLEAETLHRETMSRALAVQLARSFSPAPHTTAKIGDRRLRRVVDYIEDNIVEDLSLKDMAAIAAMSPYHFARAFKAATDASPLQYVINARIERAKAMLKSTRLPISEIAFRAGYRHLGHFSRHFKSRVGTTPGAYRQD